MKEDGCGKTENKGVRIDEEDGIFSFEGEDEGERVWIVLGPVRMALGGVRSSYSSHHIFSLSKKKRNTLTQCC
jgi:hypothetical protein